MSVQGQGLVHMLMAHSQQTQELSAHAGHACSRSPTTNQQPPPTTDQPPLTSAACSAATLTASSAMQAARLATSVTMSAGSCDTCAA